jgi:hypothetical protein
MGWYLNLGEDKTAHRTQSFLGFFKADEIFESSFLRNMHMFIYICMYNTHSILHLTSWTI